MDGIYPLGRNSNTVKLPPFSSFPFPPNHPFPPFRTTFETASNEYCASALLLSHLILYSVQLTSEVRLPLIDLTAAAYSFYQSKKESESATLCGKNEDMKMKCCHERLLQVGNTFH